MAEVGELITAARQAWSDRDLWKAKGKLEAAFDLEPQGEWLARARLLAGVVARELGDTHMALTYLHGLMSGWDMYPDSKPLMEGACLYNLALVRMQRREPHEAIRLYEQAEAAFRAQGMDDYLRQALQNRAWALCGLGDAEGAREALAEAEPVAKSQEAKWQQEVGWAYLALVDGDLDSVLELGRSIPPEAPALIQAQVSWLAGRAFFRMGDLVAAERFADLAIQWGQESKDTRRINDGTELLRECRQQRTQGA